MVPVQSLDLHTVVHVHRTQAGPVGLVVHVIPNGVEVVVTHVLDVELAVPAAHVMLDGLGAAVK